MPFTVTQSRGMVVEHRPFEGGPAVCPLCTRLGVGNHQGPVGWPCEPYRAAVRVLAASGEMRPLTENAGGAVPE